MDDSFIVFKVPRGVQNKTYKLFEVLFYFITLFTLSFRFLMLIILHLSCHVNFCREIFNIVSTQPTLVASSHILIHNRSFLQATKLIFGAVYIKVIKSAYRSLTLLSNSQYKAKVNYHFAFKLFFVLVPD